ncbi:MAG: UDP-N-acetylenolpyruvoylglucosamine reductase [Candidatus Daviesbacteria bacterium GW2011_GWF2_38_7]|nr:MAG: UDP-N-acetylenolpyruvoylglucosamine reductase [Candidatus Daviesbacteria bacterium GW2011_GWF2_38_7]
MTRHIFWLTQTSLLTVFTTYMDSKFKLIVDSFGKERFKFDEPLKGYTACSLGGPARLFFIAFTQTELIKIIKIARQLEIPYFLFGTGTKIAISDAGFEGLVIKNRTKNIQTLSVKGKVTKYGIGVDEALIEVDSGVSLNKWIEYLDSQGLESAKFAGIPGSIGGNMFLNKFLQSSVKSIKVLDSRSEAKVVNVDILSPKRHIILSGVFRVKAKII